MKIKLITKQTMYRNLKDKEICIAELDVTGHVLIGLPFTGTFSGGLRGRQGGFSIKVSEDERHPFYTDRKTKYGQSSDKTFYIVYMHSIGVAYGLRIIN